MTREELSKIPFQLISHLNMEHEHCSSYSNMDYGFYMCKHTKKNSDGTFGRTIVHYMYKDKVYKTLPKFLEAIKDVDFKGLNVSNYETINKETTK